MRALGFDVKKPEVLSLMREYDRENTGRIEFGDFYEISNDFERWFVESFVSV